MGDELFYVDEHGKKRDAKLHEELLDNPAADLAVRRQSFKTAVTRGIPREIAKQLFGDDAEL